MTSLPPLRLRPIAKPRPWGGDRLARLDRVRADDGPGPFGESWEVADLPPEIEDGRSVIVGGPLDGRTLRAAIESDRAAILGDAAPGPDGGFPLLVKLLDAGTNLSVQVHPPAAYVAEHPGTHLKSEAWLVLEAEPDAAIYAGLAPGTTADDVRRGAADGTLTDRLVRVPVAPGDCHYLPAGTCHALGGGLLVAEVQTPSDTTFRLFDWGRTGRELHVAAAIDCLELPAVPVETRAAGPIIETEGVQTESLLQSAHFDLERIEATRSARLPWTMNGGPEVLIAIAGRPRLETPGHGVLALDAHGTAVLPAALAPTELVLDPGDAILRATVPPRARPTLA